jgi:hypothetical protein
VQLPLEVLTALWYKWLIRLKGQISTNTKAPTGSALLVYIPCIGANLHRHFDSSFHTRPSMTYSMTSHKQLIVGRLLCLTTGVVFRNIPTNDVTICRRRRPHLLFLLPLSLPFSSRSQAQTMCIPSYTPSSAKSVKKQEMDSQ